MQFEETLRLESMRDYPDLFRIIASSLPEKEDAEQQILERIGRLFL